MAFFTTRLYLLIICNAPYCRHAKLDSESSLYTDLAKRTMTSLVQPMQARHRSMESLLQCCPVMQGHMHQLNRIGNVSLSAASILTGQLLRAAAVGSHSSTQQEWDCLIDRRARHTAELHLKPPAQTARCSPQACKRCKLWQYQ